MVWRSDDDINLLVTIVIPAKSNQMKSTMTFYLMFLKTLFILVTWALLSQIRYSLVVILGLNSVSGVQYKDMMIDRWWKVSTGIIDVVKSEV